MHASFELREKEETENIDIYSFYLFLFTCYFFPFFLLVFFGFVFDGQYFCFSSEDIPL